MAANANGEYKVFRYYEGLCSSSDFPKEMAKVLALGVKTKGLKDGTSGQVVEEPTVLRNKNWDIVYPTPDASLNLDLNNLTTAEYTKKIENQISKISDTVILRTSTTPRELDLDDVDDLTTDDDANKTSLTMYLEIYHPTYIANPEEYPLDCERKGITPKLVTKEMYEHPYQNVESIEEYIYQKAEKQIKNDTTVGSIDLRYETCDNYVSKINDIIGNTAFCLPSMDNTPSRTTISSAYLSKIKQNDADLYELILNTLGSDGAGMEPKDYILLESLTIEITRENGVYTVVMEGNKKLTQYTIPAQTTYMVKQTPINGLTPEFYLDGTYIPLDVTKFHVNNKEITFDEDIVFEATTEGLLVVRYEYEYTGSNTVTDRTTLLNNHYVLMRLFDQLNDECNGPADNLYNTNGETLQINSHISPWSKLSWYQDFEEIMVDTFDSDVSINNIHDGIVYVPLETPGLNSDTKIRYWINTNNDRFSLIVMGNPSLDYERDRHLVSACYCGRIDSFDNSINDTAGNFALFTSSSTEPCNTTLTTEQMMHDAPMFTLTDEEVTQGTFDTYNIQTFIDTATKEGCLWSTPFVTGQSKYYVQLQDKRYFNRKIWPRYLILKEDGTPMVDVNGNGRGIQSALRRNYIMNGGKSDLMEFTLNAEDVNFSDKCTLYVIFSYFEEKYVITSGVTRDIFGNVVNVEKNKDYGANTSDGVTSISMYHTRSKAYYQRHHMLFATTEEYMSKVMYGKSSYTGEYYADRIKVTHGNDGPRGTLSDLLVIDSSSLYSLDELVINKDFEKDPDQLEETFIYFPITAPFSPLSDSPNSRYGFAIKKKEVEPPYDDEDKILKIAANELSTVTANWWPVSDDLDGMSGHPPAPMSFTTNGCSVYWRVIDNTAWYDTEDNKTHYVPVRLAVKNTAGKYDGSGESLVDYNTVDSHKTLLKQGETKGSIMSSFVKISGDFLGAASAEENALNPQEELDKGIDAKTGEGYMIAYGTSTVNDPSFKEGARVKIVLDDHMTDSHQREKFEYNIEGIPYTDIIPNGNIKPVADDALECEIVNASPDQYLYLYLVKARREYTQALKDKITNGETLTPAEIDSCELIYEIVRYTCLSLAGDKDSPSKNFLLQYPCNINILTQSGKGKYTIIKDNVTVGTGVEYFNSTIDYNGSLKIALLPEDGYKIVTVNIYDSDKANKKDATNADKEPFRTFAIDASNEADKIKKEMINGNSCDTITLDNIDRNVQIKANFTRVEAAE